MRLKQSRQRKDVKGLRTNWILDAQPVGSTGYQSPVSVTTVEERKFTGGNKIPVDYLENKRREREREGNEYKGET